MKVNDVIFHINKVMTLTVSWEARNIEVLSDKQAHYFSSQPALPASLTADKPFITTYYYNH